MNLVDVSGIRFEEIRSGGCFTYSGALHMKIDEESPNAYSISDGMFWTFTEDEIVKPEMVTAVVE